MAGGSNGYRAILVKRQPTPVLISLLPGTAGLPPFISFSTSYAELDPAVRRPVRALLRRGRDMGAGAPGRIRNTSVFARLVASVSRSASPVYTTAHQR